MHGSFYNTLFRGSRHLRVLRVLPSKINSVSGYDFSTKQTMPKIKAFPDNVLMDEKLSVMVEGLEPEQEITIKAAVCENQQKFSSYGCYIADKSGVVDISKHESCAGTYTGVDSMGLFWSMHQDPAQMKGLRLMKKDVTTPLTVQLSVYNNHLCWDQLFEKDLQLISNTKVNRWFKAKDVRREEVKVGKIRGALFTPPGPGPFPGVIDAFGSAGGLMDYRAALLASRGYCVLALAFFWYDDLPSEMHAISLDYFKESVDWFSSLPTVKDGGIGFMGVSKGAELGLLTVMECPQIKAFVNINGIPFCSFFPVKYGDGQIPCVEFHLELCEWSEDGITSKDSFIAEDQDFVPLWTTDVKLLSLISEEDKCLSPKYNHHLYRLIPEDKKKNYEMIVYPGAGHLLEPPYSPHCGASYHKLIKDCMVWGGNPKDHNTAQVDAWQRVLQFFHTNLGQSKKLFSHL